MSAVLFSILVVVGSTALAVCGMLFVRTRFVLDELRSHHEVAGYLLGVVGTLYAVLLGLVVVDVQSKHQQARTMEETEASSTADLFHLANSFPNAQRMAMQNDLIDYVNVVVDYEWHEEANPDTRSRSSGPLRHVWRILNSYEPKSFHEQASYQQALATLSQLSDSRRYRIISSRSSISPVLWAVLLAGAALTVLFTYFFGLQSLTSQMIMTSMLSVCLSLNVLLVLLYSNPYKGDLQVQPSGFRYDQRAFQEILKERAVTP
ncbi:MAG: hypothetical protein C5B53_10345 [Candidatus Melainabacteria bacterium]|nr:MAG: hypothetical protein C5B53_10345 [Candidatus Melainabacteria bacterium]